jgi:hypothetical protein
MNRFSNLATERDLSHSPLRSRGHGGGNAEANRGGLQAGGTPA